MSYLLPPEDESRLHRYGPEPAARAAERDTNPFGDPQDHGTIDDLDVAQLVFDRGLEPAHVRELSQRHGHDHVARADDLEDRGDLGQRSEARTDRGRRSGRHAQEEPGADRRRSATR